MHGASSQMRVVVSKRVAGLGSCLISLLRAWDFARRTGRSLVIDWRNSVYLPNPAENLFDALFQNRTEIAGVPIITGKALADFRFPEPFYPQGWNQEDIHGFPDRYIPSDALDAAHPVIRFGRAEQYVMCTRGNDPEAPTVVFHHGLRDGEKVKRYFPDMPHSRIVTRFFDDLRESENVRSMADAFAEAHFDQRPIIGLHIRHGNGEFTNRSGSRLGKDPGLLLDQCKAAMESLGIENASTLALFLCSDSVEVYQRFKEWVPNLISMEKKLLPEGAGALHMGDRSIESAEHAMVEMLLLSRCDALVHTQSQFTFYPLFKNPALRSCALGHVEPIDGFAEHIPNN